MIPFLASIALSMFCCLTVADAVEVDATFLEEKGDHFIVRYPSSAQRNEARQVLSKAEHFYDRVASDIGYVRYDGFWTWDYRVKIILFQDQVSYLRFTGQPKWSLGYASRDSRFFRDKAVVSFSGQENFYTHILPHEIAHLLMWDFFDRGIATIPVWFEEGVAQLQEQEDRGEVRARMKAVVEAKKHIPLETLNTLRPSQLPDEQQVSLFYAQSLSVVLFLRERYGQDAFYRLSRKLREGDDFLRALNSSYMNSFRSWRDVEEQWIRYLSQL